MAVPRLRDEARFLRLDPAAIDDVEHATTIGGSADVGERVSPAEMEPVDLVVSGSVAVNERGERIGKGEGYSDLEFAILREFGLVDDATTTATTVHEVQVIERRFPTAAHDVPMDRVFTPERAIRTDAPGGKPTGIAWEALEKTRIEEVPILQAMR